MEALPDPNGLSNALDTTNRGVYGDPEPLPGKTPMADLVERLHMRLHTFVGSDRTRMLDVLSALDAARIGYSSIASKMSALAREVATLVSKTDVETGRDASLVIIAEIEEMRASDSEESVAITSAINLVEEQKGVPAMISADVSEADAMAARYRTVEIPLFRGSLEVIEGGWTGSAKVCVDSFVQRIEFVNTTVLVLPTNLSKQVNDVVRSTDRIDDFLSNDQYKLPEILANLTRMEAELDFSAQAADAKQRMGEIQDSLDKVDVRDARSAQSQFDQESGTLAGSLRTFVNACNVYLSAPDSTPLPDVSSVSADLADTIDIISVNFQDSIFSPVNSVHATLSDEKFVSDMQSALESFTAAQQELQNLEKTTRDRMVRQLADLKDEYNTMLTDDVSGERKTVKTVFESYEADINRTVSDVADTADRVHADLKTSCSDGEEAAKKARGDYVKKLDDVDKDYRDKSEGLDNRIRPIALVALFVPVILAAWIVCLFGTGIAPSRSLQSCTVRSCHTCWMVLLPMTAIVPALIGCAGTDAILFLTGESCDNIEPYILERYDSERVQVAGRYYFYKQILPGANLTKYDTKTPGAPPAELQYVIEKAMNYDVSPVYRQLESGRADLAEYEANYTLLGELRGLHNRVFANITRVEESIAAFSSKLSEAEVRPLYLASKSYLCCDLMADVEKVQRACAAVAALVVLASLASVVVPLGGEGDAVPSAGADPAAGVPVASPVPKESELVPPAAGLARAPSAPPLPAV